MGSCCISLGFKRESWVENLGIVKKLMVFEIMRLDMIMKGVCVDIIEKG